MRTSVNDTFVKEVVNRIEQEQNDYTNPTVDIARANTKIPLSALERYEIQIFEFNELLIAKQDDLAEQVYLGSITEEEAEEMLEEYESDKRNELGS